MNKYLKKIIGGASLLLSLAACKKNEKGGTALVQLKPMFIIGNVVAAADITLTGNAAIEEAGVCWSTAAMPTPEQNSKATAGKNVGDFRVKITNLKPRTDYHIRGYVIAKGITSYSEESVFRTIGESHITYELGVPPGASEDIKVIYDRLKIITEQAISYVRQYTSATKHLIVTYNPNVERADGGSDAAGNGIIRFGSLSVFQQPYVALHEINHTFGTGNTQWWNQAMPASVYIPSNADEMLAKISGGKFGAITAYNGDFSTIGTNMHWSPYGMNNTADVTSEWDYVYNALILEAMRKDGLPNGGPYTP